MPIGVVPNTYAVVIRIDGVDITSTVPYESMQFEDFISDVSTFRFTSDNPSGITPARGQRVKITRVLGSGETQSNNNIIFSGFVTAVKSMKIDQGIINRYEIECSDDKIRLEKSIVSYTECTGSEADIVTCLFGSVYPNLDSFFDFDKLINSIGSDFDLTANNDSLLDMLKKLSDLDGQDFAIRKDGEIVTFEAGGYGSPAGAPPWTLGQFTSEGFITNLTSPGTDAEIFAGGNPGYCYRASSAVSEPITGLRVDFKTSDGGSPASKTVRDVTFDYYVGADSGSDVLVIIDTGTFLGSITVPPAATWATVRASTDFSGWSPPYTDTNVTIRFSEDSVDGTSWDYRVDNIYVETDEGYGGPTLQFGDLDDADFDLDIDTSDEYAFDIDLDLDDFDFNSITVVGGNTEVAIDWTYESDGDQNHFDLETAVSGIAVFKNTNTDASPTWTAQTVGTWGEDELTSDGGSADVLYDTQDHWLLFDSNPSNLSKSIRVTGNIQKPLKVRVEDVESGDPTFAKAYFDDNITTEEAALEQGNALLDKRNKVRRLSFKTHNPGLRPGTVMTVTDTSRGLNESLVIRRVATTWLGASGYAQFEVECGPDDQQGVEHMFANTEKRLTRKAPPSAITAVVYTLLVDADGDYVIDANSDNILVRN